MNTKHVVIIVALVSLATFFALHDSDNTASERKSVAIEKGDDSVAQPGQGPELMFPNGMSKKILDEMLVKLRKLGIDAGYSEEFRRGDWTDTVTFPDGTQVDVVMTRPPASYRTGDVRDYGPVFETMVRAAGEGDGAAALTAWQITNECVYAPSIEDYQAREHSVREKHEGLGFDPTAALARFERSFNACQSISTAERANSQTWLERAAALGNTLAMRALSSDAGDTYSGYQMLERAWQQGDADTLNGLARAYRDGWASIDGQPDKMMHYAYAYLAAFVWNKGPDAGDADTRAQDLDARFARSGQLPDAATRDAAIERARDLLLSNQNCCVRPN